jgi:hypothetical protein
MQPVESPPTQRPRWLLRFLWVSGLVLIVILLLALFRPTVGYYQDDSDQQRSHWVVFGDAPEPFTTDETFYGLHKGTPSLLRGSCISKPSSLGPECSIPK